jgi:hypothetical protein
MSIFRVHHPESARHAIGDSLAELMSWLDDNSHGYGAMASHEEFVPANAVLTQPDFAVWWSCSREKDTNRALELSRPHVSATDPPRHHRHRRSAA